MRVITRLNIGGPAIHVSLLASRLDPTRYETLLVSGVESGDEGNMLELGRLPPIDPRILPTLGRAISPLDDLRALTGLVLLARSFKPDIVHTHLAKAGVLGRIAARIAGVRTVVHTYHGSVFRGYFGQRESAVYLGIERALARITTRIVAITSGQKADLVDLGIAPSSKIVEIPLGLDLDHFRELPAREAALSALGLPREGRYVVTRLSALFALDSLGGGFVSATLVSYFFFERFGAPVETVVVLFFAARVLNALSHLAAARLARWIGLVNTMVFTHIPSSLFLASAAIVPSFPVAAALFLVRESLAEMDVPTRQSYVMAVVRPEERTVASGVTNLVRLAGWAAAPAIGGALMEGFSLAVPLIVGAALKTAYDVALWLSFHRLAPPEEHLAGDG